MEINLPCTVISPKNRGGGRDNRKGGVTASEYGIVHAILQGQHWNGSETETAKYGSETVLHTQVSPWEQYMCMGHDAHYIAGLQSQLEVTGRNAYTQL